MWLRSTCGRVSFSSLSSRQVICSSTSLSFSEFTTHTYEGREGGRKKGRKRGREGEKEGGREGGRERVMEGEREGRRKGGREGERNGGREGGKERRREGERMVGCCSNKYSISNFKEKQLLGHLPWHHRWH